MGVRGQYVFLFTLDKGHFITVIVCLVILFIDHEHILPKKAPHPLRIRCLFLFLDCQKFNSPFFKFTERIDSLQSFHTKVLEHFQLADSSIEC